MRRITLLLATFVTIVKCKLTVSRPTFLASAKARNHNPSLRYDGLQRSWATAAKTRNSKVLSSVASPIQKAAVTPTPPCPPAKWHSLRRQKILKAHPEVKALIGQDWRSLPLLVAVNLLQLNFAIACGHMDIHWVLLASYLGTIFSYCQFMMCHDLIHGGIVKCSASQRVFLLRALTLPSIFGYYLYLRFGHLSHHRNLGEATYADVFTSSKAEFEDGDVMFAVHRQQMLEHEPWQRRYPTGWQSNTLVNMAIYCASLTGERIALFVVDKLIAILGYNPFFENKPPDFHEDNAAYARIQLAIHFLLLVSCGWHSLLYLLVSELCWTLPIHPISAMFVSNHWPVSKDTARPQPSCSVYAGPWFDLICFGGNFHVEHHDFPDIPWTRLSTLNQIASEFYDARSLESFGSVQDAIWGAFEKPSTYAGTDQEPFKPNVTENSAISAYKENVFWRALFDFVH